MAAGEPRSGARAERTAATAAQAGPEDSSIWQRVARPAAAPRTTLTYPQIAEAAIALADADGLDAVSMRRLASELGVAPMALYRYIVSKDDLIELMVDTVRAADPLPEPTDWREAMRTSARQIRAATLSHPWLLEVSGRAAVALTPNGLAAVERSLSSLDRLGLDVGVMMDVVLAVGAYARGAVQAEISLSQVRNEQRCQGGEPGHTHLPGMRWLVESGRYPTFQRYLGESEGPAGARFEFGLDCLLGGIAGRLGI